MALRWIAPARLRLGLLVLASYVFYASWGLAYTPLLLAVSAVSFGGALLVERFEALRRPLLVVTVVLLVSALGLFKYAGFFLEQLRALGLDAPRSSIVLPLGISFYTFTAIAYVADVYRGEKAERSILVHLGLIAFFPHLVAGPIVRKREISDQLRRLDAPFDPERAATGGFLILLGLFKKMVLADGLSVFADAVFAQPSRFSSAGVLLGILAYSGQILCDFSGYTDVGIGSAKLLGIDFPQNFNLPYLARSPADFWRRWHMTLSRWLRDYLYVALGGQRPGAWRRYTTPILTMTLGGLWHGAAWTFVAWGLYHGLLLAGHQAWVRATGAIDGFEARVRRNEAYAALATVFTFALVCAGWVLFRAESFADALEVLERLIGGHSGRLGSGAPKAAAFLGVIGLGHFVGAGGWAIEAYERAPGRVRGLVWIALLASIYLFSAPPAKFIYFQF